MCVYLTCEGKLWALDAKLAALEATRPRSVELPDECPQPEPAPRRIRLPLVRRRRALAAGA